jgi:hypothetical protein
MGLKEIEMITSEKNMKIYEEEFKQRAYDGKWERIGKIADDDNAYTFVNEHGSRVTTVPFKWVTLGVYDYLMEIAD